MVRAVVVCEFEHLGDVKTMQRQSGGPKGCWWFTVAILSGACLLGSRGLRRAQHMHTWTGRATHALLNIGTANVIVFWLTCETSNPFWAQASEDSGQANLSFGSTGFVTSPLIDADFDNANTNANNAMRIAASIPTPWCSHSFALALASDRSDRCSRDVIDGC